MGSNPSKTPSRDGTGREPICAKARRFSMTSHAATAKSVDWLCNSIRLAWRGLLLLRREPVCRRSAGASPVRRARNTKTGARRCFERSKTRLFTPVPLFRPSCSAKKSSRCTKAFRWIAFARAGSSCCCRFVCRALCCKPPAHKDGSRCFVDSWRRFAFFSARQAMKLPESKRQDDPETQTQLKKSVKRRGHPSSSPSPWRRIFT